MKRRPPRSTLFPYPTLFRSDRLYKLDRNLAEGEYAIATKSGETRIWEFSSAPLGRLADGRRLVISMALDITSRKQSEEALSDRKSTRLNSSHANISYAVFCL